MNEPAQSSPPAKQENTAPGPTSSGEGRRRRSVVHFLLLVGAAFLVWWLSGYFFSYTDDAYVTSDLVSVAPEVTGPVSAVHALDNQVVTRGDVLFEIEQLPFQIEVQEAQARVVEAESQFPVDRARLADAHAALQVADAEDKLAGQNLGRQNPLSGTGVLAPQVIDTTRTAKQQSAGKVRSAQALVAGAESMLKVHEANAATARASLAYARWRLSRTRVTAPVDGKVTHLTLRVGDMAVAERPLLAVVDAHAWRVIANFKEYYVRHMPPGHVVWIWYDAYPWHFMKGKVQGIQQGISRAEGVEALVPYVEPSLDWIRLDRRIPVRVDIVDRPPDDLLLMGSDARTLVWY